MRDALPGMAIFAAVVDAGGFTAAARVLGLSKSAVSKHVSGLEDRLGVRLLARTTRRLSLTEAGARYVERCRRVVAEAEAAEAEVGLARDRPSGRLRVTAPVSYGMRRLADPVADFLADFPDLEIELVLNDRAVDLIEEGFDVAMRIGVLRDSTLIARRLAPIEVETAAAPAYLDRHGEPATPAELSGHACLGYSYLDGGTVWSFRGPAGPARRRFKPRLLANNGDVLAAAAVRGEGVVQMPRFILEDRIAAGQLRPILAAWRPPAHGLYAVYPAGRPLPAKTRAFIDFVAQALA